MNDVKLLLNVNYLYLFLETVYENILSAVKMEVANMLHENVLPIKTQLYQMFEVYKVEMKKLCRYFDTVADKIESRNELLSSIGDLARLKYINARRYWTLLKSIDITEQDVHNLEYFVKTNILKGETNLHKIELVSSYVIEKLVDKLDFHDDPRVASFRLYSQENEKNSITVTVSPLNSSVAEEIKRDKEDITLPQQKKIVHRKFPGKVLISILFDAISVWMCLFFEFLNCKSGY